MIINHNKSKNKFNWIGRLLSTSLSIFFLSIIFIKIDILKSIETLTSYNVTLLFIPLLSVLLTYIFDGICQYTMFDSRRVNIITFVIRILQAQLFSLILPGKLCDASILILLKEESKGKLVKAYLFSKLITVSVLLIFSIPLISVITAVNLIIPSVVAIVFFTFVILSYMNIHAFRSILMIVLPQFLYSKIKKIHIVKPSLKAFILTFGLTIIRLTVAGFGNYILLKAGGMSLSYTSVLPIVSLVFLAGFIPITPMGLGVVESGYVYLYGMHAIDVSAAFTVPLIGRLFQIISLVIFSLTLFWLPIEKQN